MHIAYLIRKIMVKLFPGGHCSQTVDSVIQSETGNRSRPRIIHPYNRNYNPIIILLYLRIIGVMIQKDKKKEG